MAKDRRYKSQFETSTSNGLLDVNRRTNAENHLFNIPANLDKVQRPAYGTINFGNYVAAGDQYGEFEIILKNDVLKRTTVTFDDSLNIDRWGRKASPFYDTSIGSGFGEETKHTIDLIERTKSGTASDMSYIEAQTHNGFTVDDIDSIAIDNAGLIPMLNRLFSNTAIKFIIRKGTLDV